MLTSIGTPSKAGAVLRGGVSEVVEPQKRTPSPCTTHGTPSALGIAACAACGSANAPTTAPRTISFLPCISLLRSGSAEHIGHLGVNTAPPWGLRVRTLGVSARGRFETKLLVAAKKAANPPTRRHKMKTKTLKAALATAL